MGSKLRGVIKKIDGNVVHVNFKAVQQATNTLITELDNQGFISELLRNGNPKKNPVRELFFRLLRYDEMKDTKKIRATFKRFWESVKTFDDYILLYKFLFDTQYIDIFGTQIEEKFGIPKDDVQNYIENKIKESNNRTSEFWLREYKLGLGKDGNETIISTFGYFAYEMLIEMIDVKDTDYLIPPFIDKKNK